jgi:hypothetical protein
MNKYQEFGDEFNLFDEGDDPFVNDTPYTTKDSDANVAKILAPNEPWMEPDKGDLEGLPGCELIWGGPIDNQDTLRWKDEVTQNLIVALEEYMSFSSMRSLLKLIVDNQL